MNEHGPNTPIETQVDCIMYDAYKSAAEEDREWSGEEFPEQLRKSIAFFEQQELFTAQGIRTAKAHGEELGKHLKRVIVAPLSELEKNSTKEVGGTWDGKNIRISGKLVKKAVVQRGEYIEAVGAVKRHEEYHKDEKHEDPLKGGVVKNGKTVFPIGGTDFTQVELLEAMNTIDTGSAMPAEFRSEEYKNHVRKLQDAVRYSRLGITLDDVRRAINIDKDMSGVIDWPLDLEV